VREGCGSVYHYSLNAAERGLDSLCRDKSTVKEDAWMFYKGSLMDIGFSEDTHNVYSDYMLINIMLGKTKPQDTVILYHIHPDSYKHNRFSPPSANDLVSHAKLKPMFDSLGIVLIERMFDGRGVWEFDANATLIEKVYANEKAQYDSIYFSIESSCVFSSILSYGDMPYNCPNLYSPTFIDKYIQSMKNMGVLLKFTPSDMIGKYY